MLYKNQAFKALEFEYCLSGIFFDVNSVAIWEQFTIPAVSMANRKVSSTS